MAESNEEELNEEFDGGAEYNPEGLAPEEVTNEPLKAAPDVPNTVVSRLQMLEHITGRDWWSSSQTVLVFTLVLWAVFLWLMTLRADTTNAFQVSSRMANDIHLLVAHTSVSGVPLSTPAESSTSCRCACSPGAEGLPQGPCDSKVEVIDFAGLLPSGAANWLQQQNNGSFPDDAINMVPMTWDMINTSADAWLWVEHGLIPLFWGSVGREVQSRSGLVLSRNLVIGGLRVRLNRGQRQSPCQVSDGLNHFYNLTCLSTSPATDTYTPAGLAVQAAAVPGLKQLASSFSPGKQAGTYEADFLVELPVSHALNQAEYLRRTNWIDAQSLSFQLQGLLLNAEAATYALLTIAFTFPATGSIQSSITVDTFPIVEVSLRISDWLPEIFWLVLMVLKLRKDVVKCSYAAVQCQLSEYLTNLWNWVDWLSTIFGIAIVVYWFWIVVMTQTISMMVVSLPIAPLSPQLDLQQYSSNWASCIDLANNIVFAKGYYQLLFFWYTSILTLLFLKGCVGQAKLAMIQISLARAFWDVLHFMVIFIVVFANFSVGGRYLFGAQMLEFSTYARAAGSTLQTIMGAAVFPNIYAIAPVSGSIWYWLMLLCIFFIMLNLLLVILIDRYSCFRKEVGSTAGVHADILDAWQDFIWRCEWRKDQYSEGEYKLAVLGNPYADLVEGLMEKSKLTDEQQAVAKSSCLGLKLYRKHLEDLSVEGLQSEGVAGAQAVTSLELRQLGADATTAEHLLEECARSLKEDQPSSHQSQVGQFRVIMSLMRKQESTMNEICEQIEDGVDDRTEELELSIQKLESSLSDSLEAFRVLKHMGIETLAPLPLGQGGEMKQQLQATISSFQGLMTSPAPMALRDVAWGDAAPRQASLGIMDKRQASLRLPSLPSITDRPASEAGRAAPAPLAILS